MENKKEPDCSLILDEQVQRDFKELMNQIEPFLESSKIVFESTKGKWMDSTTLSEINIQSKSIYR